MDSLVNTCHRSVLFSIVKNAKDATQISDELNISLSAVYKTLNQLESLRHSSNIDYSYAILNNIYGHNDNFNIIGDYDFVMRISKHSSQ